MKNKSKERAKLEKKLRVIWDSDDFVAGVISNSKTEENWNEISWFIDMTKQMGDELNSDDIAALSLVLGERVN